MTDSPTPRPIRQAATLIVLRDGAAGLEVLLLRRADKASDQYSGAIVFPGGVLDAHDRRLHGACAGVDDAAASARLGLAEGGLDFYAAAVRECFEEAGLLFAQDAQGQLVDLQGLESAQLEAMRHAAAQGTEALLALCEARGWQLAMDRLAYFSHWLTPPGMPRRFDTRFFLALVPPRQQVRVDGAEIVEHSWLRPADALEPARGLLLLNVQRRILEQLTAFAGVQQALAHASALRAIPLNMPRRAGGPEGQRPVNIDDPAYAEVGLVDPDGRGHARHTLEGGLVMQLTPHVWRVTAHAPGAPQEPGAHSYFVGDEQGWALIDPMPEDAVHTAALRAAAPGPVRWLLCTGNVDEQTPAYRALLQAAWPGAELLRLRPGERHLPGDGPASLRGLSLPGEPKACPVLLQPEDMLFTGLAAVAQQAPETVRWIAPALGFIRRVGV